MLRGSSLTGLRLGDGDQRGGGSSSGTPLSGPGPTSGVRGLTLSVQTQNMATQGLAISGALDGSGYALVAVRGAGAGAGAVAVSFVGCQTGQIVLITVAPVGFSASNGDVTLPATAAAAAAEAWASSLSFARGAPACSSTTTTSRRASARAAGAASSRPSAFAHRTGTQGWPRRPGRRGAQAGGKERKAGEGGVSGRVLFARSQPPSAVCVKRLPSRATSASASGAHSRAE